MLDECGADDEIVGIGFEKREHKSAAVPPPPQ
jgi:hypothetical protein